MLRPIHNSKRPIFGISDSIMECCDKLHRPHQPRSRSVAAWSFSRKIEGEIMFCTPMGGSWGCEPFNQVWHSHLYGQWDWGKWEKRAAGMQWNTAQSYDFQILSIWLGIGIPYGLQLMWHPLCANYLALQHTCQTKSCETSTLRLKTEAPFGQEMIGPRGHLQRGLLAMSKVFIFIAKKKSKSLWPHQTRNKNTRCKILQTWCITAMN